MKRIMALFIVGLFIASIIPASFAEEEKEKVVGSLEQGEERKEEKGLADSRVKEIVEKKVEDIIEKREEKVKERTEAMAEKAEEIRERQKERLMNAVEKCSEKNLSEELCEKKLEKRVELVEKLEEQDLERLKKIEERKLEKLEELRNISSNPGLAKYREEMAFRARKLEEEKLREAKERYIEAKEKYQEKKQEYNGAKEKFREKREELKLCEAANATGCSQKEEDVKENAKEFLISAADNVLEQLNKIKANAEANEDISDQEAAAITAEIDALIQDIKDARATAEKAQSKEELMSASATIKNALAIIKAKLAVHTGRIVGSRIGGIIVKIKHLEVKLERILARMEEKGIDTSGIQPLIDDFSNKTAEAKAYYEQALEKFKEAGSAADVKSAYKLAAEGNRLMKESHKALQEAQKKLREIIVSIKQAGGEEELAAPEDEVEREIDLEQEAD